MRSGVPAGTRKPSEPKLEPPIEKEEEKLDDQKLDDEKPEDQEESIDRPLKEYAMRSVGASSDAGRR